MKDSEMTNVCQRIIDISSANRGKAGWRNVKRQSMPLTIPWDLHCRSYIGVATAARRWATAWADNA
jgi:hypothetical protein